jgi:peptide/nickel transport system substrate-binding protein
MPQVSDDGLVVTIPLRSGVKFHSGNELTAEVFVFSWTRLKNIKFQASFLAMDYWDSAEAVDPLTLRINLKSPNAALVAILSSTPLAASDSKLLRENGGTDAEDADQTDTAREWINAGNSAGTGPYKLTAWDIDDAPFLVLYQPLDQKAARATVQGVATHSVYQIYLRDASKSA